MNTLELLQQSEYNFFFVSANKFLTIKIPQLNNFFTLTPESLKINIDIHNSGKLLKHPETIKFIKNKSQQDHKKAVIIPFKPSGKIEHICHDMDWIYAANPAKLNRFLEDKINFSQLCQKYKLPTIPSSVDTFNQKNFEEYQKKFNKNLVIQTRFGWAGKSTFQSSSWQDIKNKIPPQTPVKYSPLISGYSLINNCCLTSMGLIQSPPGLQYTGLPQLTKNPFTTVGRQWPSFAPNSVIDKIKIITQNFSQILKQLNYRGYFGLDFLIQQDQVFILECNPRLTASFELYHQIETKNKINSLFFFHLLSFLPIKQAIDISKENERFYNHNIIGSEITPKNDSNDTTNRYRSFTSFSQQNDPVVIDTSIIKSAHETE